jgi:hypothetical protein
MPGTGVAGGAGQVLSPGVVSITGGVLVHMNAGRENAVHVPQLPLCAIAGIVKSKIRKGNVRNTLFVRVMSPPDSTRENLPEL